jgi:hypothetical protein
LVSKHHRYHKCHINNKHLFSERKWSRFLKSWSLCKLVKPSSPNKRSVSNQIWKCHKYPVLSPHLLQDKAMTWSHCSSSLPRINSTCFGRIFTKPAFNNVINYVTELLSVSMHLLSNNWDNLSLYQFSSLSLWVGNVKFWIQTDQWKLNADCLCTMPYFIFLER